MANGYIKSASTDPQQIGLIYGATLGRVDGHSRMAIYGHRATPVAGDDVWEGGGAYPLQAAATKLEILSASGAIGEHVSARQCAYAGVGGFWRRERR